MPHNKRARIGITTRIEQDTDRFYLARFYSEALEAAGCVPLLIPLIPKAEYVSALMEDLDGVLLPGSDSDVDPLRYEQEPHAHLGTVQPVKDETDMLVLAEIERRALPLLAICFGMQILNVSRGGTLIQDIRTQLPQSIKHEQGAPRDRHSHRVRFHPDSFLREMARDETALVNSHHHQAIEKIGRHLAAVAWTADGLIEALEDTRADHFVTAVQWHPEINWEQDNFACAIFNRFAGQAAAYRNRSLATAQTIH